jgi:hypothetical protein
VGGDLPVVRKQAHDRKISFVLVKNLQGLAPSGLLAIIDLSQVHHGTIHHRLTRNATTLHNAEVAVLFAILLATMNFQMHSVGRMPEFSRP